MTTAGEHAVTKKEWRACLQVNYSGFRSRRGCARLTWFGLLAPDRPLIQGVVTGGPIKHRWHSARRFPQEESPRLGVPREGPAAKPKIAWPEHGHESRKRGIVMSGHSKWATIKHKKRPPTQSAAAYSRDSSVKSPSLRASAAAILTRTHAYERQSWPGRTKTCPTKTSSGP